MIILARHSGKIPTYDDKPHLNVVVSESLKRQKVTYWIEDFGNCPLSKVKLEKFLDKYLTFMLEQWEVKFCNLNLLIISETKRTTFYEHKQST